MYPYLIFYRIILTNFNYKIAEKIIAGIIIGFMIGVIMVKYDVSFYIGKLWPFKIIILYMISNTLIVIIDHMFFTKSNTDPNVS
jgi:F0F1-type ATP synthase assembly protein I